MLVACRLVDLSALVFDYAVGRGRAIRQMGLQSFRTGARLSDRWVPILAGSPLEAPGPRTASRPLRAERGSLAA